MSNKRYGILALRRREIYNEVVADPMLSYATIGKKYNISRQRVCQIVKMESENDKSLPRKDRR